jgi:uncharacterized membrane protein YbhN (UPF0104 family)
MADPAPSTSPSFLNSQDSGLPTQRRRVITTVAVAALLGGGVWFLIGQAADYSKLARAIGQAGSWWLLAALAASCICYFGYALLYQALSGVADGPRPPWKTALRVAVAIFGASVVATAAGRLGAEYWTLRRMGESAPQAWSRVLAINTAQWALLAGGAFVGAVALLLGAGAGAPLVVKLAWLLALPVCAVPAIFLSSPARSALAQDRGGPARRTLASALRGLVLLRVMAGQPRFAYRGLGGGLLYWAGELLTVWAALHAFGVSIGFFPLVVAYATGYVSTTLPLPAGGAGGVDAANTFALTLVGVALGPALLATLVQRICTYWLPLVLALVASHWLKRLGSELPTVPRPSSVA